MMYENKVIRVKNESLIIYLKLSIFINIYIGEVLDSIFFFINFLWKVQKPFSLKRYTSSTSFS